MATCAMNLEYQVENLLSQKFETKRVSAIVSNFISCIKKFEEGDWETSLVKAGKFIEAIIKLLWIYAGKSLPTRQKDFKASVFAQKIIDQIDTTIFPNDSIRLQIPRASIFVYNITSNRGGRHDSDEVNANEMDSSTVLSICSWRLAELFRFSTKGLIDIEKTKKIIDSLIERKYPIFEEIEGRIYVDNKKFKSAPECSILILFKAYPRRISKSILIDSLKRHNFKESSIKLGRLSPYIDIDENDKILLRATGRRRVKEILNKK